MIDYEEKLRRLQCLEDATQEMNACEENYRMFGEEEHTWIPFEGWSHDGEINVIYDRNGRVDHVTEIDDSRGVAHLHGFQLEALGSTARQRANVLRRTNVA